jgi:hypothetical protein
MTLNWPDDYDAVAGALADAGTYAPDEVPEPFEQWVRDEIARRHGRDRDDGQTATGV